MSTEKLRLFSVPLLLASMLLRPDTATAAIVFRLDNNWQGDIYVMKDDGSDVRQLTNTPLWEVTPSWSPDGRHIVFAREFRSAEGQQIDIFIMGADGTNEQRLTQHPTSDTFPTWSPDGKKIAFSSRRSGHREIHVLELANGEITQLTDNTKGGGLSSTPDWAPNGQHIAYEQVIPGGGRHIYIIDSDGKNAKPFLKKPQPHLKGDIAISRYAPRWSPDGGHLLYFEDELRFEPAAIIRVANHLIIVDKHGQNPKKQKIPKNWRVDSACWGEHSTEILLAALPNGLEKHQAPFNLDIYRYHIASGQLTQLTDHLNTEKSPDWTRHSLSVSPEGKSNTQWGQIKEEK